MRRSRRAKITNGRLGSKRWGRRVGRRSALYGQAGSRKTGIAPRIDVGMNREIGKQDIADLAQKAHVPSFPLKNPLNLESPQLAAAPLFGRQKQAKIR